MDLFASGLSASLEEILESREWRQSVQNGLTRKYLQAVVVAVKLNIPGFIKSSPLIKSIFQESWEILKENAFESSLFLERITGPEGFLVFEGELSEIKKKMIAFEESSAVGRLFDLDVIKADGTQISRTALGFEARKCFVCGKIAKECARQQSHNADEIRRAMNELVK